MSKVAHLAIDLGASSGRSILGVFDSGSGPLALKEVNRFEHIGLPTPSGPVWNLVDIWRNILDGLKQASTICREDGTRLASIGVDTWGVDWALLGPSGELLGLPHCYRDPQNDPACTAALEKLGGFPALYERTGIQLMSINSLFQIYARFLKEPKLFDAAARLVFIPDLFHFWLSGEITVERTIASTSSMLDVRTGDWDREILRQLGMPTDICGPISAPGTNIGTLRSEVAELVDAPADMAVVLPATHDTAAAVAAIPGDPETRAYLSSGTWSLLGAELREPDTSPGSMAVPFTNELGVDSSVRYLKNITGMWLIQELRREQMEKTGEPIEFADLVLEAGNADSFRTLIDPNDPMFAAPGNMTTRISQFAKMTGQPEPETIGDHVRCCLESLALCYRDVLETMESVLDRKFSALHIVGGGAKNGMLNQLAADSINRPVVCGPFEATAIGNILTQAVGFGTIADMASARKIVEESFDVKTVEPTDDREPQDRAFKAYLEFKSRAAAATAG